MVWLPAVAPDGLPAVGALSDGDPGLWASCGHEGSGVALGPVSGLLLAQLITGEAPARANLRRSITAASAVGDCEPAATGGI